MEPAQATKIFAIHPRSDGKQHWLWLDVFYMQFPLDGMEDNSYFNLDILRRGGAVLASSRFVLNKQKIQTGPVSIVFSNAVQHSTLKMEVRILRKDY